VKEHPYWQAAEGKVEMGKGKRGLRPIRRKTRRSGFLLRGGEVPGGEILFLTCLGKEEPRRSIPPRELGEGLRV